MVRFLIDTIITLAFAIVVFLGVPKVLGYFLKVENPIATITSASMWPVFKTGDLIFVKKIAGVGDIKVGDIVVYKNEKGFTVHRVVKMLSDKIITRGDANNVDDAPVAYVQVEGKVLGTKSGPIRVPFLGKISFLLKGVRTRSD